jgi:hypothetical protein
MDPTQVGITLAYAEIKSLAQMWTKHPDNDTERTIGEHVLTVMERHLHEAREEQRQ